eukprot:TRINITY_DN11873_c0_g1_i1.p2 TRINITY_DN11873_c0_g1~~TRINITY_DN11873_c0_g1_i1.p2  ORF type:complete len:125 (-),score=23.87 TRINITY_DN11873_c0_g1_i1:121-495(-)
MSGTITVLRTLELTSENPPKPKRKQIRLQRGKNVQWATDVVDNEGTGKKSSKCCCIYTPPKVFGESSDEESSSSDDEWVDSSDEEPIEKKPKKTHKCCGHNHNHKHDLLELKEPKLETGNDSDK